MKYSGRRKKKKRVRGVLHFMLHLLMISLLVGLSAYTVYRVMADEKKAKETIYEKDSLREEAAARAYVWLSRVNDMPFSYEEIAQMMGDLELTIVLTPTGEKGVYARALDESSYETCRVQAEEAFGKAYRETVRHRCLADGYEAEISDEMLDDAMRGAYGVTVAEYLASCDVRLLPELQELKALYSGNVAR